MSRMTALALLVFLPFHSNQTEAQLPVRAVRPVVQAFLAQADVPLEIKGDVHVVKVPKVIVIQEDRTVVKSLPFTIKAPLGGALYSWDYPDSVTAKKKLNVLEVTNAPKGPLTISVEWVEVDFKAQKFENKFGTVSFDVGDVTPPTPPPGPTPPPEPPTPAPSGFRVIMVSESSSNMTKEQINIWNSTKIAAYLNAKCVKDGNISGWRKWDKDIQTDKEPSSAMKQLFSDSKSKLEPLPSIIIAVGNRATVYPMPATEDATMELLKKHGG